jgi:hypothetical protein
MQMGIDFLRNQLDDAVARHDGLVQSITQHESEAEDLRFRDLCARHLPRMREHQRALEELRGTLGSDPAGNSIDIPGAVNRVAGTAVAVARSLADAPQSDYDRLSADLSLARQLEVKFRTFRDAGRELKIDGLARVGEKAERDHDDYSSDARRLLQSIFVERARGAAEVVRSVSDTRTGPRMS